VCEIKVFGVYGKPTTKNFFFENKGKFNFFGNIFDSELSCGNICSGE